MSQETKVRNYTDKELTDRVRTLRGFKEIPVDYWVIGIESNEKEFNNFGAKFYLMHGDKNIAVAPGTTYPGTESLLSFAKYGLKGAFIWKTDEIYYDMWSSFSWDMKTKYLHKGKMKALRQNKPVLGWRDSNKNRLLDKVGEPKAELSGFNFHTNTYLKRGFSKVLNWLIGGWSFGCQVLNDPQKYYDEFMPRLYEQRFITYAILEEF